MKKIVPDPPLQSVSFADAEATERAFAHYELPRHPMRKTPLPNTEDILNNLDSILRSAAATAYESADQLSGTPRQLAMASVHLIELAQSQVDGLLAQQY
ncbi:DUF6124 family protein [Pseudomonas gingeri]|uniref:DUF3077 domain-containing protein n=1 Tax=Pseudomonas gingeri TaxID=117681 RepID=A0A7Y7YDU8_9PSED|nr:hypothetical protein [Pseudomonas gingeri]NWA01922.1 hypothetical protein [Pseudomonas gingeri]NWA12552.1 hypothetical protein [Pseudomonas gingeri]NWA58328.1 hypothetical protein [Pseudomonas gingeri]NWA98188.1 hypothetical protein [Pseudomonas gingeri]NWB04672.1 hypothetical protein [Pseudomonas gingeri]